MPTIVTGSFKKLKPWNDNSEGLVSRALTVKYSAQLLANSLAALPSVIRADAESLGLPVPFVSTFDGLLCKSCDAELSEREQNHVTWTARFDNKQISQAQQQQITEPDPMDWRPIVKVFINQVEIPLEEDINGRAITNSAGVRLLERLLVPDVDLSFQITANLNTIPSWFTNLRRTMSSGSNTVSILPGIVYTAAAKTLRYLPEGIEADNWNGVNFLRVRFRLDVVRLRKFRKPADTTPQTYTDWNSFHSYLDCGFTHIFDGKLKKITLSNGEEPREELLLFGDGTYDKDSQAPEDAVYRTPEAYTEASYSSLPGVS